MVGGGDARGHRDAAPEPAGVRSVRRALDLLDLFDREHQTWSVRALVDACGLPKTTVIRLVATLEERGLLWHRRDGTITVGPGLLRWAGLARSTWEPPEPVVQVMADLSRHCGETVNLYIRSGTVRVCVAQRDGPQSLRHVVSVGDELPLWAGAASKILLADADEALLEAVADRAPKGQGSVTLLREALRAATVAGYAVSHGERELGASGLAAPVRDPDGRVIAALGLGGPTGRFRAERIGGLASAVMAAAREMSRLDLGQLAQGRWEPGTR
jgi:DNA-binding IclR family transcriptional regulator